MYSPDHGSGSESAAAGSSHSGFSADFALSLEEAGLMPLVDGTVLEELDDELAGSGLARRFARDYAGMWDLRYSRLAAAMESQDTATALDAVISLKITSAMVGGLRLARLAELLEAMIRQGDFGQSRTVLERVAVVGGLTIAELQATYLTDQE